MNQAGILSELVTPFLRASVGSPGATNARTYLLDRSSERVLRRVGPTPKHGARLGTALMPSRPTCTTLLAAWLSAE